MKKEQKLKVTLQANGRAFVAGVYLTPLQALGVVQQLSVSIPLYESQLIRKPSKEQEAYIDALKQRLAAAEEVAQLRWEEKGDKKNNKKVAS